MDAPSPAGKRGRRFKAAGANETQRVPAGCFVRGLSCARRLGFGAKSVRREGKSGTLREKRAATQGLGVESLRREEESGTLCENLAATQGLGVESLRRGGCWGKISHQARKDRGDRKDRGVVRDERSPGGAGDDYDGGLCYIFGRVERRWDIPRVRWKSCSMVSWPYFLM